MIGWVIKDAVAESCELLRQATTFQRKEMERNLASVPVCSQAFTSYIFTRPYMHPLFRYLIIVCMRMSAWKNTLSDPEGYIYKSGSKYLNIVV